ncbi:formate/nitrite transporter family protein [Paenibacillus sp. TRM 82003]|nr:formate/nitrite transporter family protein [Paenibacillus sp. TRM 82003]
MAFRKPDQIASYTVEMGVKKSKLPYLATGVLGFQAGAFIALGYLLSIRITAGMPAEWGSLPGFIGASVFPIGLILTLVAGGELLTGNMMAVPIAAMARKVALRRVAINWTIVTATNFLGAIFVAYAFGHVAGLTETGIYLEKTIDIARHKIDAPFLAAFVSGIGCNWLVALAVWLYYSARTEGGKLFVIWLPTMAFVAIGFQHVVANMFVIPAAVFAGGATWAEYVSNFVPVFLGNAVGGSLFVAGAYALAYLRAPDAKPFSRFDSPRPDMEK